MGTYSTNERAEQLMGRRRTDAVVINMPCENGYRCPVCKIVDDENLQWSEYNAFLWCPVCDRDYPSALCVDINGQPDPARPWLQAGPEAAINVYLNTVRDAIRHATGNNPEPDDDTPPDMTAQFLAQRDSSQA